MEREVGHILEKINRKDATVLTSQELCDMIDAGDDVGFEDVDVVTAATRAIMSGTYAVLSFPVETEEKFSRASAVTINGVDAHVGPCPNERLGILDLMVFGTAHSHDRENYGGGHLFRDIVEGNPVDVDVVTDEGKKYSDTVSIEDMPYARLFATRHAFKNYSAFVNFSPSTVSTIFHATTFAPDATEATLSGCGQINPVKNDPQLHGIGVGSRILLNGAEGFILGSGTRSSPEKPNLIATADMHSMEADYMGGFATSAGPECIVSWAVAVPVVDDSVFDAIRQTDGKIPLPVMDADRRVKVAITSYADAWKDVDLEVAFNPGKCRGCDVCEPMKKCPMESIYFNGDKVVLNRHTCFNCGLCSTLCSDVFRADLGSLKFDYEGKNMDVPIVVRQSDRKRALIMAEKLRDSIKDGTFILNGMVERISP
jgi:putative methanogenesis marker 16 metalloprotein